MHALALPRVPPALIALFALLAFQAGGGGTQPPPAPPPLPGAGNAPSGAAVAALRPGELPETATPEARAAWERIRRGHLESGAPVKAFVLHLDVRYRADANRTNDVKAVYSFLAPAYVRVAVEGKRDALRGPAGDWLVDRTRKDKVELKGRENAEDRRQLDETVSIAKTFLALTDPGSLRVAALQAQPAPPGVLPAGLQKRGGELAWVSISSPDFRLVGSGASAPLFRAALGTDRKTGRVELALVEEDLPGPMRPSARLVQLVTPKESQGFVVPQQIVVYSPADGRTPPAFAVPAGMDLWIRSADLRAQLRPDDFLPE